MAKLKTNITKGVRSVKGLSTNDILQMDVYKLKTASLKKVINRLVSSANKRLRRLYKNAPSSPVLRKHIDDTGALEQFSSKGLKHRNDYEILMKNLKNFLNAKTSTISGFKEYREDVKQSIGEFEDEEQEKDFWHIYNQWIDTHPNEFNRWNGDTNTLQAMIYDEFVVKGKSARGTKSSITRAIKRMLNDINEQNINADEVSRNELKNNNAFRIKKDF